MNQPTWSTDVFIPAKNGTTVSTSGIRTNAVPAGIYTVWLEGHSGNPYFQTRRYRGAGQGRRRGPRLQPGQLDHQRHHRRHGRHGRDPDLHLDHQRQRDQVGRHAAAR